MIEVQARQGTRRFRRIAARDGAVRCRRNLQMSDEASQPVDKDAPPNSNVIADAKKTDAELPLTDAAQSDAASLSLEGKRVVICEDEGVTQLQLRRALTRAGMDVIGVAINGRQGLEIALRERPDIVLMDIHMPIMDGLEAARRILETYSVCVLMLTAFSDEEYLGRAQAIGTSGYILKPVTSDTLLPQLRKGYEVFLSRPRSS